MGPGSMTCWVSGPGCTRSLSAPADHSGTACRTEDRTQAAAEADAGAALVHCAGHRASRQSQGTHAGIAGLPGGCGRVFEAAHVHWRGSFMLRCMAQVPRGLAGGRRALGGLGAPPRVAQVAQVGPQLLRDLARALGCCCHLHVHRTLLRSKDRFGHGFSVAPSQMRSPWKRRAQPAQALEACVVPAAS